MTRNARFAAAAATVLTLLALPIGASPARAAGEPSSLIRYFGDASSATGNALGHGECDLNGDGYDDAVVGAWFWDKAPWTNVGAAYVLFGGPAPAGGDLNVPGAAGAARIDGPGESSAFVGFSVACLGDVNGDGIDDLAISHYVQERAYVVLGATQFGSVDLGLLGDRGFQILGSTDAAYDYNVGNTLSSAGDVNGDGYDDIAVGGVVADTQGRTNNGRIWIVKGKPDVADVELIDTATGGTPADGEVLATIDGAGDEDRLGQGGLAPAGDVNGDGVDDFVMGAYAATPWGSGVAVPGGAWVVRGAAGWGAGGGATEIDLAALGSAGFEVYGPQRQRDRLGISVAGAGDVNGDGLHDLILGGDGVYNAATGQRPGSAWVVFGSAGNDRVYTATDPSAAAAVYSCAGDDGSGVCAPDDTVPRGYWIQGADSDPGNGSESTGYSLDQIGDVNGDGIPDFAIGAYGYDPVNPADPATTLAGGGAVWVVFGKTGTTTQDLSALTPAQGYRLDGLAAGDRFGRSVSALGDVDGNGSADYAAAGDLAQRPLPPETPRAQAGEVAVALMPAPPAPPAAPPAATATAPSLRFLKGKARGDRRRGVIRLAEAGCPAGSACALGATSGRLAIGKDRYRVRLLAPAEIAAGGTALIAVKLPGPVRRAVRRAGAGRLELTLRVAGGSAGETFRVVAIRARDLGRR